MRTARFNSHIYGGGGCVCVSKGGVGGVHPLPNYMLGYTTPHPITCEDTHPPAQLHAGIHLRGQTDSCKNITFSQLLLQADPIKWCGQKTSVSVLSVKNAYEVTSELAMCTTR